MSQLYARELLRGVVEPLLLFLIGESPMHGYQIAKELEKRSLGHFRLTESTIYSALRRLESKGLVLSWWQRVAREQKRRCYELTEKGHQILAEELAQWRKFHSAANKVLNS